MQNELIHINIPPLNILSRFLQLLNQQLIPLHPQTTIKRTKILRIIRHQQIKESTKPQSLNLMDVIIIGLDGWDGKFIAA